ncbi:XrtA/PEP-CTERM system TPR-repeat protein PrsT [Kordiimonas sp.]|uniref:XrtA/PEP-CTERM system TPR-repeat protein PrsT n=1 Tax=Kordiimonas sp. TaxID=1970157 RepID=UPI003A8CBE78
MVHRSGLFPRVAKAVTSTALAAIMLGSSVLAQDNYEEIKQLFEARQYAEALKELQGLQGEVEADSELYLLLARAYLETGAGIAAEAAIERARRLGADYAGTATLFAKALLLQGKYAGALGAIRGVIIAPEEVVTASIIAGDANFALKNLEEARRSYKVASEKDPENFQAYLGLARLEMRSGDLLKAEELIKTAAQYGGSNTMVQYTWGLISRYLGKRDEAEQHFTESRRLFPNNIMANIELASIRIDQGMLNEAEQYLDSVYAIAPDYTMALYLSSVVEASRGQFEEAYNLLNRARDITDSYLPAMYIRGLLAYQLGHYVVAESHLRRVLGALPNNKPARMALAGTYLQQSKPSAAFKTLQPLLEVGNPDGSSIAMAAAASMAAGEVKRGHELYELLAEEESRSPKDVVAGLTSKLALARYVAGNSVSAVDAILTQPASPNIDVRELGILGGMQLRTGDHAGAELTITKIITALPERALGYNMRGTLEYKEGQYSEAFASFSEAVSKNPEYYAAVRNRALAALQLGRFAAAERDLKNVLRSQPTDARAKAALGRALLLQGKGAEAVTYFEEAVRLIPGSPDMEADFADALAQAGQTSRAIEQAKDAAVLAADRPLLLKRIGLLLLDMNQARLAVRPLSRYVAYNPNDGQAHLLHGRALLAMGLSTGAKTSFLRAINAESNQPETGMVNWYLFAIDSLSGKFGDALKRLPALERDKRPSDISPSVTGDTLAAVGRTDEAIEAYQTAMADGSSTDLALGLSRVYEVQGKLQLAISTLEDHLQQDTTDRNVRMRLGGLLEQSGLPAAATSQYEAVLREGVADAQVVARLARAYLRLGNRRSAALAERAYLIMPEDPFVLDVYGWVMLQAQREPDLAEKVIAKASRRAPSVALYRYHLGMVYLAQGRRQEALETLRQAVRLDPNFEEVDDARRQIELLE